MIHKSLTNFRLNSLYRLMFNCNKINSSLPDLYITKIDRLLECFPGLFNYRPFLDFWYRFLCKSSSLLTFVSRYYCSIHSLELSSSKIDINSYSYYICWSEYILQQLVFICSTNFALYTYFTVLSVENFLCAEIKFFQAQFKQTIKKFLWDIIGPLQTFFPVHSS